MLIGFSGGLAILATYYGSDYDLCYLKASVFHGRITCVCPPVSMALLHIKSVVFLSRGMRLSLALVVDFFQFLFVSGTIVSFCFVTVVEVLTAIMHILVRVSGLT